MANGWIRRGIVPLLLTIVVSVVGCGRKPLLASFSPLMAPPEAPYVEGEIILQFKADTPLSMEGSLLEKWNFTLIETLEPAGAKRVRVRDTESALQALENQPSISYAEPNYMITSEPLLLGSTQLADPKPASNDPYLSKQYHLFLTQAIEGWRWTEEGRVLVAVLDSGIDYTHPDLAEQYVGGYNFVQNNLIPKDKHGHGTHIAGTLSAVTNNGIGVASVAPQSGLLIGQVLDEQGRGNYTTLYKGIVWAVQSGAQVINLSLGGEYQSFLLEQAIAYALKEGCVVVAAMGNDGEGMKRYPAAIEGVIAVGASTPDDKHASFSNHGEWLSVTAPGFSIFSTMATYPVVLTRLGLSSNYAPLSGTDVATPIVTGAISLLKNAFPNMGGEEIRERLMYGSDDLGAPGFDPYCGHGRINVLKLLKR